MTTSNDRPWPSAVPEASRTRPDRPEAIEFGKRVRAGRKALRLSQEQLGERAGLHRTYVGHIERGEVNPTLHNVLLLAEALELDASDLVRGLRTDTTE